MNKIAIVGKPNVGKSTLFNRLIHKRQAIVENSPGVTRDRLYGKVDWLDKTFNLIDTGGLTIKDQPFAKNIQVQVNYAIEEADLILFLVSYKDGIDADDYFIAKLLKKQKNKRIILVVNKSENNKHDLDNSFYSLGFGKPNFVSSEHGIGTGDLLDEIIKNINFSTKKETSDERIKFCIIGRPNVGKSTLVNTILHTERVLVSPIPNTTRDSIDCDFTYCQKKYTIIDTAGIRRKGKIYDSVEKYALLRTTNAIERSNLIILVLDANECFNEQDKVIAGLAFKVNIPTIIVVNKWDLIKKDTMTMNEFTKKIHPEFKFLHCAPVIFISAKNNSRIHLLFENIDKIEQELKIKVNTSLLNDVLLKAVKYNPPTLFKGSRLAISYATQVEGQIPTFVIFTNDPKHLHFSYARYIENTIRDAFGIKIVPITIYYKDKNARIRGIKENKYE